MKKVKIKINTKKFVKNFPEVTLEINYDDCKERYKLQEKEFEIRQNGTEFWIKQLTVSDICAGVFPLRESGARHVITYIDPDKQSP